MGCSLSIGLIGTGLLGEGIVLALQLLGGPRLAGIDCGLFKGLYGALLTVVLQPVMVFSALDHQQDGRTG